MASTSEVGHAKNIANLNLLNNYVDALGTIYNPSNTTLSLANIQEMYNTAHEQQQAVNSHTAPYSLAVDDRQAYFDALNPNLTKLRRAYKATDGVTAAHLEDFMAIIRKIKGKRLKSTAIEVPAEGATQHSTSQLSYDQRTNNLELLISLMQNTPNYAPNETEYTVDTYRDKKTTMLQKTQAVTTTFIPLNAARSLRDHTLYHAPNNLVDTADKVKDYVATILPKSSPQYKAIAAIKFKKR